MDLINQIKNICIETNNEWFLLHDFPKIGLYDLELEDYLNKNNILKSELINCICPNEDDCKYCDIEIKRNDDINDLKLSKLNNIWDFTKEVYFKSIWIFGEKIKGEIPGFILIKEANIEISNESFTHELVFVCVKPKYRKMGILKNMINKFSVDWKIWLEASSNDIGNIEEIWEKCGFKHHITLSSLYKPNGYIIYKRI